MRSLAAALKDFGTPPPPARAEPAVFPVAVDFMTDGDPVLPVPEEMPEPVDVDALVAEAVAEAEAAMSARLAGEHAAALQAERDRHAEELAELQAQLAHEAGERILAAFAEMEERVVELTAAVTARILSVVLSDDLRSRSIGRLAAIIREAVADDEAVRIRVRGSLPLYEELKATLAPHAGQLDFTESPQFDLSVTIDDSMFETRLAEWSAALSEALS